MFRPKGQRGVDVEVSVSLYVSKLGRRRIFCQVGPRGYVPFGDDCMGKTSRTSLTEDQSGVSTVNSFSYPQMPIPPVSLRCSQVHIETTAQCGDACLD